MKPIKGASSIRRRLLILSSVALFAWAPVAIGQTTEPTKKHAIPPGPRPYDSDASPQQDLMQALAKAQKAGRRVLIVFGANWCPDCRVLDREFHAGGRTAELIANRYEVVKVDVGDFDRNLDFAKLYGEPIRKGIPSIVVVTPTNEVVYQTKAGELADARAMGSDGIYTFFREKADKPVGS